MQLSAESLLGVRIFAGLDRSARAAIAARCQAHAIDTGASIVEHGEVSCDVYLVIAGEVRATLYSPAGKEVAFRDLGPGETFGELSAIDGEARCASVVANRPSSVAAMSAEAFRDVVREFPDVAEAVMRDLTRLIRSLTERVFEFSTLSVAHRVCAEIARIARTRGECDATGLYSIADPPTHESIATRIGTQREAVTKELSRLRREGLLESRRGGAWRIPDLTRLEAWS